jgi:ABC-type nitrate/sulfonate/bicarbonate transport system substrate-binding protein
LLIAQTLVRQAVLNPQIFLLIKLEFQMKLNKLNLAVATIIAASSFAYTGSASADASTSPIMVADAGSSAPTQCTTRKQFTLAVSIYTGWMPWYLADQDGVLKKWGDKYCMDITVQKMGYGPSISDGYLAGNAQALVVTNIDLMTALGSSNKDTTVIVMGDFSNGNDKVLGRGVKDLNGVVVSLSTWCVTPYLSTFWAAAWALSISLSPMSKWLTPLIPKSSKTSLPTKSKKSLLPGIQWL